MAFKPLNDDHAIQQVAFVLTFNKPVLSSTAEALRGEAGPWRVELPAVEIPQLLDFRVDNATGVPKAVGTRGVEFSVKRPDGSAVTSLTVLANELTVNTTLYTRWAPTWERIQKPIFAVLDRIASIEKQRALSLNNVSLTFVDIFRSSDETPNYSEVLERSDKIPASIFERGNLWHCHSGWFVARPKGRTLNQINIDTRKSAIIDPASGEKSEPFEVSITHRQAFEFQPAAPLDESVSSELRSDIGAEMKFMHDVNKSEVASLLAPSMRNSIRIDT